MESRRISPSFRGVKSLVLGDKKDSEGDRDEIVIEGTDRIVYQTDVLRSVTTPGS